MFVPICPHCESPVEIAKAHVEDGVEMIRYHCTGCGQQLIGFLLGYVDSGDEPAPVGPLQPPTPAQQPGLLDPAEPQSGRPGKTREKVRADGLKPV